MLKEVAKNRQVNVFRSEVFWRYGNGEMLAESPFLGGSNKGFYNLANEFFACSSHACKTGADYRYRDLLEIPLRSYKLPQSR